MKNGVLVKDNLVNLQKHNFNLHKQIRLFHQPKNNKTKDEEFYSQINKSFSELKESVDALGLMFSNIKDNLEDFKSDKKSHENLLSDFKSEITRIADGISGQDTMTKAIDLARSGSSAEKIVTETGLSKSDAEALIRFHKR